MRTGTATRLLAQSGDQGTFAALVVGTFSVFLGELPPRADAADLSCLPPMVGEAPVTYLYKLLYSEEHGCNTYRAVGVLNADGSLGPLPDGRTALELHAGNLMGDILKGWAAQVLGCGCPGLAISTFPAGEAFKSFTAASPTTLVSVALARAQKGVSSSGDALAALLKELNGEDLALTYSWA